MEASANAPLLHAFTAVAVVRGRSRQSLCLLPQRGRADLEADQLAEALLRGWRDLGAGHLLLLLLLEGEG